MTEVEHEGCRALFLKLGSTEVLRAFYKKTGNYSALRALAKSRRLEKCRAQEQRVRERMEWMKNRNERFNAQANELERKRNELERERAATPEKLDELFANHLDRISFVD